MNEDSDILDPLTLYEEGFAKYKSVVDAVLAVSVNQHGFETDGRGVRAVKIFTRQTLTSLSLANILPKSRSMLSAAPELLDIGSIASLARNILESHLALSYFGTEQVSKSEAEFRFLLGQYHRNREWYGIRKLRSSTDSTLLEFEQGLVKQMGRIKAHPFFNRLTQQQKNRAKKGDELYLTKADFENRNPVCSCLRLEYRMLSNLLHPLPLSTERIDDFKGRGEPDPIDLSYLNLCLDVAIKYLLATTLETFDLLKGHLPKSVDVLVERIR